jgi:DNA topoisomerase VI subunit B
MSGLALTDRTRDPRPARAVLRRTIFATSRLLEFCSTKELVAQTGHQPDVWPVMLLKELTDNACDIAEEAGTAPAVVVIVEESGITVRDNGPGLPASTVQGLLDFNIRLSSREAYVSPTRGAQGNALKTVLAVPFVLDGERGRVVIDAQGIRHEVVFAVDVLRQQPKIEYATKAGLVRIGTSVTVEWPDSARSLLTDAKARFLQVADDFTRLNPHLSLTVDWFGERVVGVTASDPSWHKWKPSDPTCPHWYTEERLERLIGAYLAHDQENGQERTVRGFIAEFAGLTATAKQKAVLDTVGLPRTKLSTLYDGAKLDNGAIHRLLDAMKAHTKVLKPQALGIIGKDHLASRFEAAGCEMKSYQYKRVLDIADGLPCVVETAFGWCPGNCGGRRLVTGVNWSPGILNPFRSLGRYGDSLDSLLSELYAGRDEPVVLALHMACPRVEYSDRGKSAITMEG